jgi:organic hydroperoxide reductase OsmC/OhrA
MKGKTDKQFLFEVNLNWKEKNKGVISAVDVDGTIDVATPPEFGGEGKSWSPECLFLSSISSCFMTTYLVFAKKLQFSIAAFECNTIGQIEIVDGKYKFTLINVYPKIFIADESLKEKAKVALEKTHKYCLISNSINAAIFYHSQIKIEQVLQTI